MPYTKDILKTENLIFGVIWALISVFLGAFIVKIIDIINLVVGYLINALSFILLLPANAPRYIGLTNKLSIIIAILVGILLAPIIKKMVDWIIKMIKKSPL